MSNKSKGNYYEQLSVEYLLKKGYSILDRNYRYGRHGELDIIASKNNDLYIFEVKGRTTTAYGLPRESITYQKLEKLRTTALAYIKEKGMKFENLHFNLVEVYHERGNVRINIIENILD